MLKDRVNKFRYPEDVLNTSRTRREHATRVFCKISSITFFGINIGQIAIRCHLPDVFEHVVEHVNTLSNTSRRSTVIYTVYIVPWTLVACSRTVLDMFRTCSGYLNLFTLYFVYLSMDDVISIVLLDTMLFFLMLNSSLKYYFVEKRKHFALQFQHFYKW